MAKASRKNVPGNDAPASDTLGNDSPRCGVCHETATRLKRGLCPRHYQQFQKKHSRIAETDGAESAELFENDCIWRGLLGPKQRPGRSIADHENVFEWVAEQALSGSEEAPHYSDHAVAIETYVFRSDDELTPMQRASRLRGVIEQHFDAVQIFGTPIQDASETANPDPEETLASLPDTIIQAIGLDVSSLSTQSPTRLMKQKADLIGELFRLSVTHEFPEFQWHSTFYYSVRERLVQQHDDLAFRVQLWQALQSMQRSAAANDSSQSDDLLRVRLYAGVSLDQAAACLGIALKEAKLMISRSKVRLKTAFRSARS